MPRLIDQMSELFGKTYVVYKLNLVSVQGKQGKETCSPNVFDLRDIKAKDACDNAS